MEDPLLILRVAARHCIAAKDEEAVSSFYRLAEVLMTDIANLVEEDLKQVVEEVRHALWSTRHAPWPQNFEWAEVIMGHMDPHGQHGFFPIMKKLNDKGLMLDSIVKSYVEKYLAGLH